MDSPAISPLFGCVIHPLLSPLDLSLDVHIITMTESVHSRQRIPTTMSSLLATIWILAVAAGTSSTTSHAFITPLLQRQHSLRPAASTALFGGKRRGRLTNNVSVDEDGNVARIMTKRQKQSLGNSKMKKQKGGDKAAAAISPLLAEWAKEDGISSSSSSQLNDSASTSSSVSSTVFVPFDSDDGDDTFSNKNSKRNKMEQRSQRAALTAAQTQQIDALLEQIDDLLQTNNLDRNELVSYISSLVQVGLSANKNDQVLLPTLKSILSTRPKKDEDKLPSYRLAWVGSDAAICHIGTSLHKVPLARLQEVFLSLGYNRWELFEVIRILGPFPTVRNTLKGDVKLSKLPSSTTNLNREGVKMQISYTSMVDGTGKEILAGKADNIKYVDLDVWFANEKVIVATVPPTGEDDGGVYEVDPLKGDGSNVLFFVEEENLDGQLEKLRAA